MDVADPEVAIDRVSARLSGPHADREVEPALLNGAPHYATLERHPIVKRRKLDHAIVVTLENAVAVANAQRGVQHRRLADLGGHVGDLDHVGGQFVGLRLLEPR